jgi:hypothetical protein
LPEASPPEYPYVSLTSPLDLDLDFILALERELLFLELLAEEEESEDEELEEPAAFFLFLMSLLICHISLSKLRDGSGNSPPWLWDSLMSGNPFLMTSIVLKSSLESELELEVELLGVLDPSTSFTYPAGRHITKLSRLFISTAI